MQEVVLHHHRFEAQRLPFSSALAFLHALSTSVVPPGPTADLSTNPRDGRKVVASAEELVFALTMLPLVLMVGLGVFQVDWVAVVTPPAAGDVDWKLFIQIMFWTSTYWQKVGS